ncbi:KIF-binding protein [Thunnus albacares]|uniref:KIF-binding protein n=1 Tax=Thunnus maccoyii TaxID=8240 RepID=UPI001C4B19F6|nr:KIF-binding protein [Thunnus maccoyii]XP_044202992.1 KIF-binding protein [Thunnus albacares]
MASLNSDEWKAICDKFTNAQNLTDVESRKDPETDPFRSKYKARELLREIYCSLKSFEAGDGEEDSGGESGEQRPTEEPVDGQRDDLFGQGSSGDSPAGLRAAKLGAVEYYLGVNHVDTEELSAGQEHLMNCIKLLERYRVSSENVSLFIHVRNQLGILWAGRDETETAQGFLETAEAIYQRYMKEDGSPPTDMTEYFSTEEKTHQERIKRFELAYTHTMYYLAQVYKNLGQNERAATYCHSTLQRQLQLNQYSPMEWALNAATLSQYYITKGRYMEGRHCLSAATIISGLAGEVPSEAAAQESETESERREQLRQKRAEIARCWIKYCLNLLQDAKKLLEDNIGELDTDRQEELKRARRLEEEEEEKGRKSALLFGSEDTFDLIASLEEKVSCLFPLDFTEARAVFLVGQNYVTQAKEYFQMDGYVTDHIEILQDHSSLFRALAFFEEDLERRCKMHKRRVDMLEPICNDLNAQYYLMIRRQLMFELAETYNEMMDQKLTLANRQADSQPLDNHSIKKFNHLCSASAKYFQMFLDSLRSPEGKLPEHLEEEVLRPALVARFRVARLYSKLICSLPSAQLDNLNKALENYKYVVHYCEGHPEAAATVETELELSKEMVGLLPLKINRLKARMAANN